MMTMKMFPKKLSIKLTQYKKMKEILSAVNEEHGDRMASSVLPVQFRYQLVALWCCLSMPWLLVQQAQQAFPKKWLRF